MACQNVRGCVGKNVGRVEDLIFETRFHDVCEPRFPRILGHSEKVHPKSLGQHLQCPSVSCTVPRRCQSHAPCSHPVPCCTGSSTVASRCCSFIHRAITTAARRGESRKAHRIQMNHSKQLHVVKRGKRPGSRS